MVADEPMRPAATFATDYKVSTAFKNNGIPLIVLIDAEGKIVYYDLGGDETALRKAIAALEPRKS
jgi:hypothetical protein